MKKLRKFKVGTVLVHRDAVAVKISRGKWLHSDFVGWFLYREEDFQYDMDAGYGGWCRSKPVDLPEMAVWGK